MLCSNKRGTLVGEGESKRCKASSATGRNKKHAELWLILCSLPSLVIPLGFAIMNNDATPVRPLQM